MLRDYQEMLAKRAYNIIKDLGIVYLAIEMRVGKTMIALRTAELLNGKKVLFVTKKKAIGSIEGDYRKCKFEFDLTVTNYEQLSKFKNQKYDVVIVDEAHSIGAFPKPSQRTKMLRDIVKDSYLILASGTPSPESFSQLYHQFWISEKSPFVQRIFNDNSFDDPLKAEREELKKEKEELEISLKKNDDTASRKRIDQLEKLIASYYNWINFYYWSKVFVDVKNKVISGYRINDYKKAYKEKVMAILEKYFVRYTQKDAGFKQGEIQEKIIKVPCSKNIKSMVDILMKDRYYRFKDGSEVIADTAVKLQSKLHQAYSGTIKTDTGGIKFLDISKALFIREKYKGQKIAIFYEFIAEGEILKKIISNWTDVPEIFNRSDDRTFVCQADSGSEGVNIASADVLIYYNIGFSARKYWQGRNRVQTLDRSKPALVHWLFSEGGIENKIYYTLLKKKDYTLYYFKKDFGI
jgi:hypothetical protein